MVTYVLISSEVYTLELTKNLFKRSIAKAQPIFGLWLGLPDTTAAEIAAGAGFDWLLIDGEHAPFDLRGILAHLQAIAAYDVAPIVRPVNGEPALLKQLLDIGVQSLLVPMVEDAKQAENLVRAVRYPPAGIRGVGTSLARAARWGQISNYLQQADEEIFLIVQVETKHALHNIDEIAKVDGIDAVFIGPSDLSASLGHAGNPAHPHVVELICTALTKIRSAGKHAGLLCLDSRLVQKYIDCGANFIGVGVDTMLLARATRALAEGFQRQASKKTHPGTVG